MQTGRAGGYGDTSYPGAEPITNLSNHRHGNPAFVGDACCGSANSGGRPGQADADLIAHAAAARHPDHGRCAEVPDRSSGHRARTTQGHLSCDNSGRKPGHANAHPAVHTHADTDRHSVADTHPPSGGRF